MRFAAELSELPKTRRFNLPPSSSLLILRTPKINPEETLLHRSIPVFCSTVGRTLRLAVLPLTLAASVQAQVVITHAPQIGSSNPVSAEPLVPRPATRPCKVQLFQNLSFTDFNERPYTYTPPAECKGPWAKVVFSADFTVTAGRQFDRSTQIYLGNVTLMRGSTAEPRATLSPSWHVESDVTDLSALFQSAQNGIANIQNPVDSTYTGIIYGNAELDFYPASYAARAPRVPDVVLPIYNNGDAYHFYTPASPLTETISLPTNVERVYLDVTAQSDEFWYLTTPNAKAAPYINADYGSGLREVDVSIDGTPAGIAPEHPFIFTGGVDPYLWEPLPSPQALNFKFDRVDLTPFAGVLSDGKAHTIVLNDINTQGSSLVNGNLLVYTDHGKQVVTGSLLSDTLTATPATTVTANVNLDASGNGTAEVKESLKRTFSIRGKVNTSHGEVTTTVEQTINFIDDQNLTNSATLNLVNVGLTSTVDSKVTTAAREGSITQETHTSLPLQLNINLAINPDGTYLQTTTADLSASSKKSGPFDFQSSSSKEEVKSTDALGFNASFSITSHTGASSTATYRSTNEFGARYNNSLASANNVLTEACSDTDHGRHRSDDDGSCDDSTKQ